MQPKASINEEETKKGLRMLLFDAICSQCMGVLTGGAFLIAALHLGASNVIIGLLAALGPLAQMLQIPAIFLIERTGLRKAAMVISSFGSRLFWIAVATTVGAGLSLLAGMSVDFLKTHFPEVGIYALHRLVLIKEAGEVEEKIVI